MLLRLFASRTRVDLLTLFFSYPERRFYVRQVARELKRDISGIKRELDNLEKAGIVTSEKIGNLRYYSVNRSSPLFPEMKGIIAKTAGVQIVLKEVLERIEGIRWALLYTTNPGSEEGLNPLELLLIGPLDLTKVNQTITTLERRLSRAINYLVFDESDFRKRKVEDDPFISEVLRSRKVILVGKEDEL